MHVTYLVVTTLAAVMNGYAAALSLSGAASVKAVAGRVQVSEHWMTPFGAVLASGAAGLLAGIAWPALGASAATGLVLYFVCAVAAHVRAHDAGVGGAVFFLLLAAAALTVSLADNHAW